MVDRLLLGGLFALITIVATENMAVATVMPLVETDLGDLWLYGWVFSAFQLGTLVGIVAGGHQADRTSPAVPLAAGLVVFCAGLVVAGAAGSMPVLVAGRALQGFGAGVVPTVAYVCVGRGFPAERRPMVFAVLSTAWVLPSLVAPLVASAVGRAFGWRWVFLGLIPVAVVAGLVAMWAVAPLRPRVPSPDSDPGSASRTGASGLWPVAVLVVGSAVFLTGLGVVDPLLATVMVAAGVTVAVLAFARLTPAGTLSLRPRLPAAVGLRGMLTFSFFAFDAFVSLALTSVRGTSTLYAGLVYASGALTWTVGSWLQARLMSTWGAARLVRLGSVVLIGSLAVYAAGLWSAVPVWTWFLGSMLAGFGMGTAYSPLSVVTLGEAAVGGEGAASTALQLSDVLGVALGTGVAGAFVAFGERLVATNAPALLAVAGMCMAVLALVVAGAGRLVQATAPEAAAERSSPS